MCLDKKNSLVKFEMRHNLLKRALRFLPRWPGVIISTSMIKSPIFILLETMTSLLYSGTPSQNMLYICTRIFTPCFCNVLVQFSL